MKKILFWIQSFALYLVALLPFPLLYLLSDICYLVIYYLIRYRRQVVYTNLKNSFPDKTETERKIIERKFFRYLTDQILETAKMLTLSKEGIKKHFRLNNPEEIQKYFDAGRSVLAVTGHYGNWEWGSLIISASVSEPLIIVFKPVSNKGFEELINHVRSKFGAIMVPMKHTLRKIVEMKSQIFCAVFVSDQTPTQQETQYFINFLNQQTAVFLGIEKIAKMTNYPIVYCHINRIKRGYYENTFFTLSENPVQTNGHELTDLHTKKLEDIIKAKPELWLWSHKRWKFQSQKIFSKNAVAN